MTFALDQNLDFIIKNGRTVEDSSGISAFLTALYTNGRVGKRMGYWADIPMCTLWQFFQSRNSNQDIAKIENSIDEVIQRFVSDGIFTRIDRLVSVEDTELKLKFTFYNEEGKEELEIRQ